MNILKKIRLLRAKLFGMPDTFTEAAWMHKNGCTESKEIINDILWLNTLYINNSDGVTPICDSEVADFILNQIDEKEILLTSLKELREVGKEAIVNILELDFQHMDRYGLVGKPIN